MNKLKKIICFILSFCLLLSVPITTYATEGNGTSESGGKSTERVINGPSANKQFWLVYITDKTGRVQITNVVMFKSGDIPTNSIKYIKTRPQHQSLSPAIIKDGSDFGWSFGQGGEGRGTEVKEYLKSTDDSSGQSRAITLIEKYWGKKIARDFVDKEWYLVLENGMWCDVYKDGKNTGISFAGTAYGFARFQQSEGIEPNGDYMINRYTNNVLPNSSKLQFSQTGLKKPTSSGKIDNTQIMSEGYGCIILWAGESSTNQTTYEESKGDTPAMAPDESKGDKQIIKNYRIKKSDGTYEDKGCFQRKNVAEQITIEDEQSYKVIGYKTSDSEKYPIDSIKWNPPGTITQKGSNAGKTLTLGDEEHTLYILLQKAEEEEIKSDINADYIVKESQITRAISLKTTDTGRNILAGYQFNWAYGELGCNGHTRYCEEEDCGGHSYTCDHSLSDSSLTLKLQNTLVGNYTKNIAYNMNWIDYNSIVDKTRDGLDGGSVSSEHDYKMVVHRGEDKLSIAEWKNTNPALDSLADFSTSNNKTQRKKDSYTSTIKISFDNDSPDLSTSSSGSECSDSDTASFGGGLDSDITIGYEVYSGSANGGKLNTKIDERKMVYYGTQTITSGRMVDSGLQFTFRPYIKMRYNTLESSGNITKDKEVFILGQYEREMQLNDWAEVSWKKQKEGNLQIYSSQWSTHAQPAKDKGTESVLPGGAVIGLIIPKSSRQVITVRTYQAILEGDGRKQVEKTTGSVSGFTIDEAKAAHKSYVDSIIEGLSGLGVAQYENQDNKEPFKGQKVYTETDIGKLQNGNKMTSSEEKYYFKLDNPGAVDSGLLDVKTKNENPYETRYVFSTNISGQVLMNGTVILSKDQGVESLTGIAKDINEKTYVVTKLVDAVERNTGNDTDAKWVNDGHWYNEAFDGITIVILETQVETGFINPSTRESVIDPKLCAKSEGTKTNSNTNQTSTGSGRGYLFTNYMTAQFKMEDFSVTYGDKEMVGIFKGNNIYMKDMDILYTSRVFYIPNVTTQDLK